MKIYLMRHGLTYHNLKYLIQGSLSDIELAPQGFEQARRVKPIINGLNIKHVYSGKLMRQIQTAKTVSEDLKDVDINSDELFNEISFGEFEGITCEECFKILNARLNTNLVGFYDDDPIALGNAFYKADAKGLSEDPNHCADRCLEGINKIMNKYNNNEDVLVVASGMVIGTFIYKYCLHPEVFSMKNCSIACVEKIDGKFVASNTFEGLMK